MSLLFVNGPVQNGDFTFAGSPGKAVGIRLASALNELLGWPQTPHLWNTVTLAADLRFERAGDELPRPQFDARLITDKYSRNQVPSAGVMTDADAEVAETSLAMIESRLQDGALRISRETTPVCRSCDRMTGRRASRCMACGSEKTVDRAGLHLIADLRDGQPVLDRSNIHSAHRRQPKHLQTTARTFARRLILSRIRDYGIDLSPIGLRGRILDPRVGLHTTAITAARRQDAHTSVMTVSEGAARNIAAHGYLFREHLGTQLKYVIHGRIPYENDGHLPALQSSSATPPGVAAVFERWFLPVLAYSTKGVIPAGQLPALFKHFLRAYRSAQVLSDSEHADVVRRQVLAGHTGWVMNKSELAAAMTTSRSVDAMVRDHS